MDIIPCPDGLFWTTSIPQGSVHVDFPDAIATMEVSDLAAQDSLNIFNALSCGPSVPAVVSFDVDWGPALDRYQASDADQGFTVRGWLTGTSMSWTAQSAGATYQSADEDTSVFALVVKERNGRFFG
ncbi:MAG TPA: hypothetical protein VGR49_07775 [Actinomycetota bacterium]|nr:hypothetical protein [Actinomycetota bacterium]